MTGYSTFRIVEETLRIDYAQHFLGFRLNFFVVSGLTVVGLVWFAYTQFHLTPQHRQPQPQVSVVESDVTS